MKHVLATLVLVICAFSANAQMTLGLSMEELLSRYHKSDWVDWKQGVSNNGGTVVTVRKAETDVLIASYFNSVSGSVDELVTRNVVIIPSELGDVYLNRLNNQYKRVRQDAWEGNDGLEVLWEPKGVAIAIVYQLKH